MASAHCKGKGKGPQERKRGRGKKKSRGLALSLPCLPTSRGMSLEGFKVLGFGPCCRITEFPVYLYGKAKGKGPSEPRCVNS